MLVNRLLPAHTKMINTEQLLLKPSWSLGAMSATVQFTSALVFCLALCGSPGALCRGERCNCGFCLQVSDLKPEVLTHIQHMLDPRGTLFEGSVVDSGSKVSGSKGKPVRHLDRERGVAGLLPLTLILDVKHQQFWQPSDSQYVLHCERYCYFPRSSTVRILFCMHE